MAAHSVYRKAGRRALGLFQALCVVHLFNEHVAEVQMCTGASMYPTLGLSGDFVLHSRWLLKHEPLERGELVTAMSPLDARHQILKRVIGLPGDTVCVDPSGERDRNHEWVTGHHGLLPSETFIKIPKGHVWLAGDNASNSTDSRDYGPIPIALLKGKVVCRIWPTPTRLRIPRDIT